MKVVRDPTVEHQRTPQCRSSLRGNWPTVVPKWSCQLSKMTLLGIWRPGYRSSKAVKNISISLPSGGRERMDAHRPEPYAGRGINGSGHWLTPLSPLEWERDVLDTAHVKLGRPNSTTGIIKSGPKAVWSGLVNDAPRSGGTVEAVVDSPLVRRGGMVAAWQRVQRHLIPCLQIDRLWKTES